MHEITFSFLLSVCAIVHLFLTWQFLVFVLCFTWGWRVLVMFGCVLQNPCFSAPLCEQRWQLELPWAGSLPSRHICSLDGFELSYIYHFPNRITCSHLPDPACIIRTILGKAAKEILLFCLQNLSPYITGTHRGGGNQLLPSVSQKPSKNFVRPAPS